MDLKTLHQELPEQALIQCPPLPFPHLGSGKVREMYDIGEHLLIIATDRFSAFDVVFDEGIPGKGIILNQLSRLWFDSLGDVCRHHLLPDQERLMCDQLHLPRELLLRSMVVRKLQPVPVEAVVRGYLAGSGWISYCREGHVCGHRLPPGLREADALPAPVFTPTTKASTGHDEPVTEEQCAELLGADLFRRIKQVALDLYGFGRERAARAGIILADTKFEFGLDSGGTLHLIDEVLTPDSSRFWPKESYSPGRSPPSFDKQFVRDFLEGTSWDKSPPPPPLPPEVISGTRDRYWQALERLSACLL